MRFFDFGVILDKYFRMIFADKSISILDSFLLTHFFRGVAVLVNDDEFSVDDLEEVEADAINAA